MSEEKPKGTWGGARAGAGRPKGSSNGIRIDELKAALHQHLGQPFQDVLGKTALKLFQDFQEDRNVDNWVRFSNNLSRYVIQQPQTEVRLETETHNLSDKDLHDRIQALIEEAKSADR